ncbi:EF hand family protein [Tritrichomonas foetus]|uniref:EF hand family protein n=1 Tax=Tritrichomonas foetus TaxID=1144522 RepID=A0A1J4K1B2_9EUKA|nr:EF hand family protein [Tritrichomonas foetus]|eukprot:OHT03542.1 EF hand family protein [Tritrichomonas foetus]
MLRRPTAKKIHRFPFEFTQQDRKELREAFNLFDKDGSGTISSEEIRVALRVLGYNPSDDEVASLLNQFNNNNSDHIDFDEFLQMLSYKLSEPQPHNQLVRAFHLCDLDGDDEISLDDLSNLADELGQTLDVDELREIIMSARGKANQFDIHTKDVGSISLSEFLRAIGKIYE